MLKIFLAHAKEDKAAVTTLYYRLRESDYQPWLDKEDLLAGQNWRAEISNAIKNSQVFIACLSTQSVGKEGFVQSEFKIALKEYAGKPPGSIYLIPLRLDNCIIPELRQEEYGANLRDIQWLDFFEPDGFEQLIKVLEHVKQVGQVVPPSSVPIRDSFSPDVSSIPLPFEPERINNENPPKPELPQRERNGEISSHRGLATNSLLRHPDRRIIRLVFYVFLAFLTLTLIVFFAIYYVEQSPTPEQEPISSSIDIEKRFSSGERLLISNKICDDPERNCGSSFDEAESGSKSFAVAAGSNGDYSDAIAYFENAIEAYPNNPEPYIYRNNALVRKAKSEGATGRKITLAAVVPAGSGIPGSGISERAEEMLRGVADAQSCFIGRQEDIQDDFNCIPGLDDLLEIVIVDDQNKPTVAKENAKSIVANRDISGVIGHYASGVTDAALNTYSDGAIPVISPASTSYNLIKRASNFFRTAASTKKLGQAMATYLDGEGIEQVFGLYDEDDEYSSALWRGFIEADYPQKQKVDETIIKSLDSSANAINSKIESVNNDERFAVVVIPPSTFNNGNLRSEVEKWKLVTQVSKAVREKNENGKESFLIGGNDLYYPQAIDPNKELDGMFLTVPWFSGAFDDSNPNSRSYAAIARRKWGRVNWVTADSYDATQIFMKVLAEIGSEDSEKIRSELIDRLQNVELEKEYSSGIKIKFDEDREPARDPVLLEVVDNTSTEATKQYSFQIVNDFK